MDKDVLSELKAYYDSKSYNPDTLRNGPINEQAINNLREKGFDYSVTYKHDGKLITEYGHFSDRS